MFCRRWRLRSGFVRRKSGVVQGARAVVRLVWSARECGAPVVLKRGGDCPARSVASLRAWCARRLGRLRRGYWSPVQCGGFRRRYGPPSPGGCYPGLPPRSKQLPASVVLPQQRRRVGRAVRRLRMAGRAARVVPQVGRGSAVVAGVVRCWCRGRKFVCRGWCGKCCPVQCAARSGFAVVAWPVAMQWSPAVRRG